MKRLSIILVIVAGLTAGGLAAPPAAQAQGLLGGIAGVATGLAGGLLGVRERGRPYHARHRERLATGQVHAGMMLPARGIQYQQVPAEFHVDPANRYAVVDGHPVLVDTGTRRVVEVLD